MKLSALLTSAAILAGGVSSAMAADYDPPSAYDWTGVYLGIQGGYGFGKSDIDDGVSFDTKFNVDGAFVGGLLGAQWQLDSFVLGAETEWNWSDIGGDDDLAPGNSVSTDVKWFGSVDAKLGVPVDRVLIYAIGGLAFGRLETGQDANAVVGQSFTDALTDIGWTVGAGIDYAATDDIIVGLRYKYFDFGSRDYDPPAPFTDRDQDVHFHTISGNLTYKF